MRPVVSPSEMAAIDADAPEPVEELIARAGAAVARVALDMLGGSYGRRVSVIAGKGNNGRDGRDAAARLRRRGVRVEVVEAATTPDVVAPCDLVIDAAYGTGMRGSYVAPAVGDTPVLAVDIASGIDGLTGERLGRPLHATRTVTFAALKTGLLFGDGPQYSGEITVADIGLDVSRARASQVSADDLSALVPRRGRSEHKWRHAVCVVAGSPYMTGAAVLCASAAGRAGASYVRLAMPGVDGAVGAPVESVRIDLPLVGWQREVLDDLDRVAAVAIGPGLGRSDAVRDSVRAVVRTAIQPMVVDGDALWAIAPLDGPLSDAARVLTPHDGEFQQLSGHHVGADRLAAARELAAARRCVVLLKGPSTVIADPSGRVAIVREGDERLASAGTGDVLTGIVTAMLAGGAEPFAAAAAGAVLHGLAAMRCPAVGMVASDLPAAVAAVLSDMV